MIALALAVGSSLMYGSADFLGGLAARGAHVLRVVIIAAPASLLIELMLWPVVGARFATGVLAWVPPLGWPRQRHLGCCIAHWPSDR